MEFSDTILNAEEPVLITGASGFIGERVLERLLAHGFRNLRCLVRPSANTSRLQAIAARWHGKARIDFISGNLLSREHCAAAARDAVVIYHLAAGTGIDSFPDAFMNSVVTTRNLLDAALQHKQLRRFVSVSSFSVYTNQGNPRGNWL